MTPARTDTSVIESLEPTEMVARTECLCGCLSVLTDLDYPGSRVYAPGAGIMGRRADQARAISVLCSIDCARPSIRAIHFAMGQANPLRLYLRRST